MNGSKVHTIPDFVGISVDLREVAACQWRCMQCSAMNELGVCLQKSVLELE